MKNYEIPLYEDEEKLNSFINAWPVSKVEKMTLEEYTDVNNKYTFTQWVENRTRSLGSINGPIGSAKFGIYKRKSKNKPTSRVFSNDTYSWIKYYGESDNDAQEVFERVRKELLKVIRYAQELNFEAIESINGFYEIYKWKLAFLYSNQSMVPVFNQKILVRFTKELGMKHTRKIEYAKMHRFLYDQKPPNLSVFNYMRKLFHEAGLDKRRSRRNNSTSAGSRNRRRGRTGVNDLNTDGFERSGTNSSFVTQLHKKFQKQLKIFLEKKYPKAKITFEKNFIDLLLITEKEVHYYEVKTANTPENCIKQGLGQLLSYSHYEEEVLEKYSGLNKKLVIFGKQKAKKNDLDFIEYVNDSLRVNFEYLSLEEM